MLPLRYPALPNRLRNACQLLRLSARSSDLLNFSRFSSRVLLEVMPVFVEQFLAHGYSSLPTH